MNTDTTKDSDQPLSWRNPKSIPRAFKTCRFVLEPLREHHAERDFAALMSCRRRLRGELQWGEWPADDFSLEENRIELRRHQSKFERGMEFAYSVVDPDRDRVLGCIYIEPCAIEADAQLAYWVIDEAIDIEMELVSTVLGWLHDQWSLDRIAIPLRGSNVRGLNLVTSLGCRSLGLQAEGELSGFLLLLSQS